MKVIQKTDDDIKEEKTQIKQSRIGVRGRPPKAEHLSAAEAAGSFSELSNALILANGGSEEFTEDDWKKFGKSVSEILNKLGGYGGVSQIIAKILIYALRFSLGIAEGIHNISKIIERIKELRNHRHEKKDVA